MFRKSSRFRYFLNKFFGKHSFQHYIFNAVLTIQALVHVSSAYVNAMYENVEEIIYPAPANANAIVKLVNELDDATLEVRTPQILKDHPNPYTFTKHLAEHEIAMGGLPATIVRPSMSEFMFAIYLADIYYRRNLPLLL